MIPASTRTMPARTISNSIGRSSGQPIAPTAVHRNATLWSMGPRRHENETQILGKEPSVSTRRSRPTGSAECRSLICAHASPNCIHPPLPKVGSLNHLCQPLDRSEGSALAIFANCSEKKPVSSHVRRAERALPQGLRALCSSRHTREIPRFAVAAGTQS